MGLTAYPSVSSSFYGSHSSWIMSVPSLFLRQCREVPSSCSVHTHLSFLRSGLSVVFPRKPYLVPSSKPSFPLQAPTGTHLLNSPAQAMPHPNYSLNSAPPHRAHFSLPHQARYHPLGEVKVIVMSGGMNTSQPGLWEVAWLGGHHVIF